MLSITISTPEEWDDVNEMFIEGKKKWQLKLEHSLVSISKWEAKWHKSFINTKNMSDEETLDYIKFMTITPNVEPEAYENISYENVLEIRRYIDNPMSATKFFEDPKGRHNRDVVTSELIYYWMIALGIPFECQKWHLNRLLTLIRVCNIKNQTPDKQMSKGEMMRRNAAINAARRKQHKSKG